MSDNWVQCPICGGDVGDEAVADYDRAAYETGVQDSMLRATQYERILLDLIAELRARPGRDVHSGSEHVDVLLAAADRAEQRLQHTEQ